MNQNLIFWPMIVQAAITLYLYFPMGRARFKSVAAGQAKAHDYKLPKQNEPVEIAKFGNAVSNQFELPMLFFVVCLATHSAAQLDATMLVLSWVFVTLKTAHSFVHITTNKLKPRFRLFVAALFTAILMWLWFAVSLI